MRIDLLYVRACPQLDPTETLLRSVLSELDISADVRLVEVSDQAAATELEFVGSPTIRVNGRDIDPEHAHLEPGLCCRFYAGEEGELVGVPPREQVRAAIVMHRMVEEG